MSDRNGSAWDIEITTPAGDVIGLMLDYPDGYADGDDLTLDSALSAAATDTPVSQRLTSRVQEDWSRGVGLDYNVAPGVETNIPGYALPAGNSTAVAVPTGGGSVFINDNPIVAFCEFNGVLLAVQQGRAATYGGRILRSSDGTGTGGGAFAAATMTTFAGNPYITAGEFMQDIIVADDGAGTQVLFASSVDASNNGRLHKSTDNGANWTSTALGYSAGTNKGRKRMATQFMQTADGATGNRLVAITGANTIGYTKPDSDPMLAASWVEDIKIATKGILVEIVAARRTFWITDSYGKVFYLDELAHSASLTDDDSTAQTGNGAACLYLDGYVYLSQGRAYRRVRVGEGNVLNEFPGNCAPGYGTRARSDMLRGYPTAVCHDQGAIRLAIHNPTTHTSAIYRGVPREIVNVDAPQPFVWTGPEFHWSADYKVTRMIVTAPVSTGDMRLWAASQSVAGGTARITWFHIPISGSSLDDLISGGPMKFATGTGSGADPFTQQLTRLELLPDTWDDKASNKILYQIDVSSEGPLDANTKLTLQARADPAPSSTSYTSLGDITASPTQSKTLPSVTQGHKTQLRVDFFAPNGTASTPTVPVLDSLRELAWKAVPSVRVVNLPVRYGDGVGPDERSSERDPDTITGQLETATGSTTVTYRTRTSLKWTAKLDQVMPVRESLHNGGTWGKTVHAQLQLNLLASA